MPSTIDLQHHEKRLRVLLAEDANGARPDVHCVLRHVSRSGMQRRISLFVVAWRGDEGEPYIADISASAARVLDRRLNRDDLGVICHGAGMDMGFELVYSLSRALYGDGYALKHRWL